MDIQKPQDPNNLTPAEQKHWPQIEAIHPKIGQKFAVKVKVGELPHPMTTEHQILFIDCFYGNSPVGKIFLKPDDLPEAVFTVFAKTAQKIRVEAFCNQHGLWGNEVKIFS